MGIWCWRHRARRAKSTQARPRRAAADSVSELRRDPILRRWVIISPTRTGDLSPRRGGTRVDAPGPCPFCPGNEHLNPVEIARVEHGTGWRIRVTPDKHPLLRIEGQLARRGAGMFDLMNAIGAHELVTDTPEHHRTWADLPPSQMVRLLQTYRERLRDLRRDPRFRYVLVLKNRGAVWSRYQHAHSHVIATPFTPKRIEEELGGAREYYRHKERCAFCDQLVETQTDGDRVVATRGNLLSFTPFASAYPYETWISPSDHEADFGTATDETLAALAELLIDALARLGRTCDDPAYSVALHAGALDGSDRAEFHWHWEIVPHLGHELGMEWATGIFSNPVAPEDAARRLRDALPA
jgi:UDPglucose--hexose-1-phosphate uridylyltransferase